MAFCLLLAAGTGVSLFLFWRQWAAPGRRHYVRGMELAAAQDFPGAEQEWLRGTREDPQAPQCFERLGELYQNTNRFDQAAIYLADAAKLDASNGELFLSLSRVQQSLRQNQDALLAAKRAAELLPTNADAQEQYGLLAERQRQRPEARAALERAHKLKPADEAYTRALIHAEMNQTDFAAAERDLLPLLATNPKDAQACYLMAVIYNQKPRTPANLSQALTYARRAMPNMVRDTRGYLLLGNLYLETQNTPRALLVFTRGYVAHPEAEGILRGLVDCYRRMKDVKQAAKFADALQVETTRHNRIKHLEQVMGFNHFDTRSGLELAKLEAEDGNLPKALVYYRQLLRQSPKDEGVRHALVAFLRQAGQNDLAAQTARPDYIP